MQYEMLIDGTSVYGPGVWNTDTMQARLFAAGYSLEAGELGVYGRFPVDPIDGPMVIGPVAFAVTPDPVPDPPSLDTVKPAKAAEIVQGANSFLAALGQEYGDMERTTWATQSAEAKALLDSALSPAPLVRQMAAQRGMDPLVLAARIIANEAQWLVVAGHVIGQRQALQDRLDAAETVEAAQAIAVAYTLPG